MNDVLVSICCLAYNHEPFIKQCLDGFIMQKCNFKFEVLIHDDASTDKTAAIIREYETRYPDIIKPIYQDENQYSKGIRPTFNFNFPRCRGKYIAICEGDDYWIDQNKLQKQVDFLEANEDYNFSMGKVYKLYEKTQKKSYKEVVNPSQKDTYLIKDYIKEMFSQTSSFMMRNNFTLPHWITKVHAADQSIVIIATSNKKIKYHDDFFSVYRINADSVSFKTDPKIAYEKSIFFLNSIDEFTHYKHKNIIKVKKINNFLFYKMKQIDNPTIDIFFKVLMRANLYLIKLL